MSRNSNANRLGEAFFSAKKNASTADLRWIGRTREWASARAPSDPEDEPLRTSAKVAAHWSGRVPEKPGVKAPKKPSAGQAGRIEQAF